MKTLLLIHPPDLFAPDYHFHYPVPLQAPAILLPLLHEQGWDLDFVDLAVRAFRDAEHHPVPGERQRQAELVSDEPRLYAYIQGGEDVDLEALAERYLAGIALGSYDALALSMSRDSQRLTSMLLAAFVKRHHDKVLFAGGDFSKDLLYAYGETPSFAPDFVTQARKVADLKNIIAAIEETPPQRLTIPIDPLGKNNRGRGSAENWPRPDYSAHHLAEYRIDPLSSKLGKYAGFEPLGPQLTMLYNLSFECSFACAFCGQAVNNKQSGQNMRKAAEDLAYLSEQFNCKHFMFMDTQINLYAEEFSRAVLDLGLDITWGVSVRIAPLKPGVVELMYEAGCRVLTIGIESASPDVLKFMRKGHSPRKAAEVLEWIHGTGMYTTCNFITHFPGERPHHLEETLRWVEENARNIDNVVPATFYLSPQSPIAMQPEKYGVLPRHKRRSDLADVYLFRTPHDTIEFDEVDGYTWEERVALGNKAEWRIFEAWRRGNPGHVGFVPYALYLPMVRKYGHRDVALARLNQWQSNALTKQADTEEPTIEPERVLNTGPVLAATRAQGQWKLNRCLSPRPEEYRVVFDSPRGEFEVHIERERPDAKFYKKRDGYAFSYRFQNSGEGKPEFSEFREVLHAVIDGFHPDQRPVWDSSSAKYQG